ncbi:putative nucleotidyltransferase, Ribonuclease H [Helianthus debilis subsp. tardiflorus]
MRVTVANGNQLECGLKCKDFKWMMQGVWFVADVLVLPLENYDMVLGVQWLATLGDIVWNFTDLTMKFKVDEKEYVLKGTENNKVKVCSSDRMATMLNSMTGVVQSQIFALQLSQVEGQPSFGSNVSETVSDENLQAVIREYDDVFQIPKSLPPQRSCDHQITLVNESKPINLRSYRYQALQKDVIEKMTQELLDSGVIRSSKSSFAAPVVLVKKKDGTWRMCVDYRQLNEATIKNRFPIPLIDELLEELGGATVFSKLDLRSGYHQVRMFEPDIHKTAFRTHQGLFEFLVMPFGLTNAPATFQALMNQTFKEFLRKFVLVFFDDILIYSKTMEQHVTHLNQVLSTLRSHQLFAKKSKCSFGGTKVEYLGHVITAAEVSTDPSKIESVSQWPVPTNVKQLRGFLGLAGYYRRFICSYGIIAKPLTDLLRKDSFHWSETAQSSFDQLKFALSNAPVLALPDLHQPFIVETDASSKGIGAVLMQNHHPLAFISKPLSPKQQALSVYDKELLAILFAIKQWHYYLISNHFIIKTDQRSLKYLIDQKITTPLQHSWMIKLMHYDFEIQYKKGVENVAADALSRVQGSSLYALSISSFEPLLLGRIKSSWESDVVLKDTIAKLQQGVQMGQFSWDQGLLKRKGKLVIGNDTQLRKDIIVHCHDSTVGGHSGYHATLQRLKGFFYCKGQSKAVREWVRACSVCQQAKYETVASPGLIQPLPIPTCIFSDISMDFITGLPKSKGKNVIFVVVDRLTKYAHFVGMTQPISASSVAKAFIDNVYKLHGWPTTIVLDRDSIFLSNFWQEFTRLQGIAVQMSTAYHPQTDGQTEVVNRCLETYIRCMVLHYADSWANWLSLAEWWYNTNYHTSIKTTPIQALYGIPPPIHVPYVHRDTKVASLDEEMCSREEAIKILRSTLAMAQNRLRQQANKHRTDRQFQEGSWVYLKLRPYIQTSLRGAVYNKFSPKYYGPFLVVGKIGEVAYKLDLPPESQLHPVFHVSLLKAASGPPVQVTPIPQVPRFTLQPAKVLDQRVIRMGNKAVSQVLVQWVGQTLADATWEIKHDFQLRFPAFQL